MIICRLKKNGGLFRRFTGLEIGQFNALLEQLQPIYVANEHDRLRKESRKRKLGGGSQFSLSLEDRLLIVLLYYKLYITHEFLGILFGLDNSNISRTINHLNPLLARIFRVPERRIRMSEEEKDELLCFFLTARNSQ